MNRQNPRVVVVGSANTDLVVSVPNLPTAGETVLGGDLRTVSGGKGANQAVAAARLGGHVTFIGRIGDDAFGNRAVASLQEEGIDTRYLKVTPGFASGVALIAVNEVTGQNQIVVASGANGRLTPEDIDAAAPAFDSADVIVLSLEVPLETVLRAAESGAARGLAVILNPAPAQLLPPALLKQVTLLTPNEHEAQTILGRREPFGDNSEFAELMDLALDAVITIGAKGAVLVTPEDGLSVVPAFRVPAVDTVAAGDCFTGAIAVELGCGKTLAEAVRFANAAAAISVTRHGAQTSLPTRPEVEAFLEQRA